MVLPLNIHSLTQRLRENDPTLTEIDFRNVDGSRSYAFESDQGADFRGLLEALRENHTVTSVNIVYRFLKDLDGHEKVELFESVGSLVNLEEFRLGSSGLAGLPLSLTNSALEKTGGTLKSLTLQSIHFKENVAYKTKGSTNAKDEEFLSFLRILKNDLVGLESFTIQDIEDTFDLDLLAQVLTTLPNLKELVIRSYSPMNQRLTQQSVIRLFASKSIKTLALRRLRLGPILPELLTSLENNNTLETLSLEQNSLNFECGMAISYLLTSNRTLKELNLGYNMLPDDVGSAMAAALSANQTLISLDLTANDLDLYSSRRFAHLLVNNGSALQHLTLNQNSLRDEGVAMVAAGLEHNTTLKSLSLAETQITEASCSVIGAALHTNSTLERLNLSDNQVKDAGCMALAVALRHNSTLTSLNLNGNKLRDESVLHLAETLKENISLERVNLGNNPHLTPVAYMALEQVLIHHNFTLKHLWLPVTIEIVMPASTISSFIRLNRLGRKTLFENMDNASMWLLAMEVVSSDIHCLYCLIRANPTAVSWLQS
jgi:Ran GTPase-activating protein (RanGAP) involved in mRNA processing and transport